MFALCALRFTLNGFAFERNLLNKQLLMLEARLYLNTVRVGVGSINETSMGESLMDICLG